MNHLFKPGEEVICIDSCCEPARPELACLPKIFYGNLYTILAYESFRYGKWFLSVVGMPPGVIYSEDSFVRPISLEELMNDVKQNECTQLC